MKIKTMKPITITADFESQEFTSDEYWNQENYWLYLWKLEGLNLPTKHEPIKLGIAQEIYKNGFRAGWSERIRGCLKDMQRAFGRDDLTAKVLALRLADGKFIFDAERYVHFAATHNYANKINQILRGDQLAKFVSVGGQSEFYDASEASMLGRFYNSLRASNRLKGGSFDARMLEEKHVAARSKK